MKLIILLLLILATFSLQYEEEGIEALEASVLRIGIPVPKVVAPYLRPTLKSCENLVHFIRKRTFLFAIPGAAKVIESAIRKINPRAAKGTIGRFLREVQNTKKHARFVCTKFRSLFKF